jgi:two-component system response regulator RegA
MPTVLLVDDSPVALHALAEGMGAAGFDVQRATTAASARLAEVRGLACAVIDIDLPDGTGIDVVVALRERRSTLPVAFFTSGAAPALMDRAGELGPVFAKPDVASVVAWATKAAQPPPTK